MALSELPRPPRFYLDENLSYRLGPLCRAHGIDVTSAQELGRHQLSDAEQLRYAASEGRILVTKDDEDLIDLTYRFLADSSPHAGLLIVNWRVSRAEFGLFVEALTRFVAERQLPLQPYEITWLKRP